MTISLLVKIESRFTRVLFATTYKNLHILLNGLYGQYKDFATYDSIVMIATGIGITACLPYMKQILEHQVRGSGKTPQ
jgi:NAD(P)H-flavin reductase